MVVAGKRPKIKIRSLGEWIEAEAVKIKLQRRLDDGKLDRLLVKSLQVI